MNRYWGVGALLATLLAPPGGIAAESEPPEATQPAAVSPAVPQIPLQRDLRFVIRPTVLGLVPPGDPEGFGECFMRVTEVNGETLSARYEIKEAQPESGSATSMRPREEVRIRRGDVTAVLSRARFDPPLFWGDGSWQSDSALLWLGRDSYAELASSGLTVLELGPPPGDTDDPLRGALERLIEQRRRMYGLGDNAPAHLIVREWYARYPVFVNGERAALPALRCTDSVELAEYWVLADPANPLLLKMTLIAPSLDDTPDALPAGGPGAGDAAERLVAQGSGFAVLSIDF